MQKRNVLVDVDDVLVMLNKSVEQRAIADGYLNYSCSNILTFKLNSDIPNSDLPERIRKLPYNGLGCPKEKIFEYYSDVKSFENAELTEDCEESLRRLSGKFNIIINTNCLSVAVAEWKLKKLSEIMTRNKISVSYNIYINNCKGKPFYPDIYAIFDDCIDNHLLCRCKRNILVDASYNNIEYNNEALSELKKYVRVLNFKEGVNFLVNS